MIGHSLALAHTRIKTFFVHLLGNVSSSVRWRCNLCKHSPLPLENLMKSHCQTSHGVANQYKCSMCSFSADEEEIVASHLKSSHSGSSQIIVNIYKKVRNGCEARLNRTRGSPSEIFNSSFKNFGLFICNGSYLHYISELGINSVLVFFAYHFKPEST